MLWLRTAFTFECEQRAKSLRVAPLHSALSLLSMSSWSPTLEGFRAVFRRPALPLAEVVWRWSFGAAALMLLGFGFLEYLNTLPVSNRDLLFLRSAQPALVSQALARIFGGSGARLIFATVVLFSALAVLWVLLASIGRGATLHTMIDSVRERVRNYRVAAGVDLVNDVALAGSAPRWRLRSLLGLNFLRATLALAAAGSYLAGFILAGFVSTKDDPHPGVVLLLALLLVFGVWLLWSFVSWFLALASIFVVREGDDTFGALSAAVGFCRDRSGPVASVGAWFGLTHFVLFVLATSVVMFSLSFVRVLPAALVVGIVLLLTLAYLAVADTLYLARLAGYVAILEAPPVIPAAEPSPLLPAVTPESAASTQHSALTIPAVSARVDQDETILSDHPSLIADGSSLSELLQPETARVDQEERILSDLPGMQKLEAPSGEGPDAPKG